ncbi:uncharacterized protein [Primulina eburnea]|uniref:uncharacterized protein n=1 Tax=Primulina eburnea TaxID=1245227 RepID=UPI003C6C1229
MIQNTIQFWGNALNDPNPHIADFLEICDTFKFNGVSDDAIRLRLFPFSQRNKAKSWLNCLPVGSITTWEDMAKAFLWKYFPPSKTMKLRADITTFSQFEQESLYEAWERYKDLLRRCPHHELPLGLVVQTFYYFFISSNRTMIDAAACGNLLRKTAEEGYELLEEMAASCYHPQSEWNTQRGNAGVHQVTDFSAVTEQLEALNRKIDSMNVNGTAMRLQEIFCEKCGGEHYVKDCQDNGPFYVNEEAPVNQIPPKLKDPRSFLIPYMNGDVFHKALRDLGASINLMPLSVFRKLGLGEPKTTRMSLQLANRSVKYPHGVIENVVVKVDKFIFPADFVVLDMEEDIEMSLILGRPFLTTGKALIDVQEGKLRLRVDEEEITFDVFNALKHTLHSYSCYRIDVVDALVSNYVQDALGGPLEATLTT